MYCHVYGILKKYAWPDLETETRIVRKQLDFIQACNNYNMCDNNDKWINGYVDK